MTCDERPGELDGDTLHVWSVPSFEDWPEHLDVGSPRFVLLVVADAEGVPDVPILDAARRALTSGACAVCAWGGECVRVERLFDRVSIDEGFDGDSADDVIMTTSHPESLEETIRFFLVAANPADAYRDACRARAAVVVGSEELAARVRRMLVDPVATVAAWSSPDDAEEDDDADV